MSLRPGIATPAALPGGRTLATLGEHRGPTCGLAFVSEGKRLVTASYDRTMRLGDTADRALRIFDLGESTGGKR